MPFQIIRNDITKVKADAIVNTANPEALIGDGVERAIYEAAGSADLLNERKKIGSLALGEAAVSPAFKLPAKYVIHSSGTWWQGGNHGEIGILRKCYDNALKLAYEHKCETIAFPLMATGTYGFPKELGLKIAVDAFRKFLENHEMEITLVVFNEYAYKISGAIYDTVESYIDSRYVGKALAAENCDEEITEDSAICRSVKCDEEILEDSAIYRSKECESESKNKKSGRFAAALTGAFLGAAKQQNKCESAPAKERSSIDKNMSLESRLQGIYKESLAKHITQLINKKGLKNSEVYATANISKQYFSKLLKDQVKPSKNKILALAVGLHLNLDETIDFLQLAGYALSPISQTDIVVEYFIEHEDYNVIKIDIVLFDYGLDPLSKG